MKLEVNITETVTPEEVANEIFKYDMIEVNVLITDATERIIDNKDCGFALIKEFDNFDEGKKNKWFAEVLKEFIKYFE